MGRYLFHPVPEQIYLQLGFTYLWTHYSPPKRFVRILCEQFIISLLILFVHPFFRLRFSSCIVSRGHACFLSSFTLCPICVLLREKIEIRNIRLGASLAFCPLTTPWSLLSIGIFHRSFKEIQPLLCDLTPLLLRSETFRSLEEGKS